MVAVTQRNAAFVNFVDAASTIAPSQHALFLVFNAQRCLSDQRVFRGLSRLVLRSKDTTSLGSSRTRAQLSLNQRFLPD